jgi:hypothetical protein
MGCSCGGDHIANYRGCVIWKEAKAAIPKRMPHQSRKYTATSYPAAQKAKLAGPCAEQMGLGEEWSHVVRSGELPMPLLLPQMSIQLLKLSRRLPSRQVTATRKTAKPKKPAPKPRAATKAATFKPIIKQPRVSKPWLPNPQPITWK